MGTVLRLATVLGTVASLLIAPSASAQGGAATPFSAAGTIATQPPGSGPCALAVAGATDASDAGNNFGVGTLTASGPGLDPLTGSSSCGGVGSIEFGVTAVTGTGTTRTLTVTITKSEPGSAAAAGATGTIAIIDLDPATGFSNDKIIFSIGGFAATLGPDSVNVSATATSGTWANVSVGAAIPNATSLAPFAGTATAVFAQPGLEDALGPCTVAVAGVNTATDTTPVVQGGGSFQALPGTMAASPWCGNNGSGAVGQASFNGGSQATVRDGYDPPPLAPGSVSALTVPNASQVLFGFGAWTGQFGPGHATVAQTGSADVRSEAVSTTIVPAFASMKELLKVQACTERQNAQVCVVKRRNGG